MSNSTIVIRLLEDFLNFRNRTQYQRYFDNSTELYNLAQFIKDQNLPHELEYLEPQWNLRHLVTDELRFTAPYLEALDFSDSRCVKTVFEFNAASRSGLPGLRLNNCDLTDAEFHLTVDHPFVRPSFQNSTLIRTRFFGNTDVVQTCMHDANFKAAKIENVQFSTQLLKPDFSEALLRGPDLNFAFNPQGNCKTNQDPNIPTIGCSISNYNMEGTYIQGVSFQGRTLCYGQFNSNTFIENSNFLGTRNCYDVDRYHNRTKPLCNGGEDFQDYLHDRGVKERNNIFCDGQFECRSSSFKSGVMIGGVLGGIFFLALLVLMTFLSYRVTKNQVTKFKRKNHMKSVQEEYEALSVELAEADADFIENLGKWQKKVNAKLPRDIFILICDMYTRQDLTADTIQDVDHLPIQPEELPDPPARILRFFDTPRRQNLRREYRENVFNELYPPKAETVIEFDVESDRDDADLIPKFKKK